MPNSSHTRIDNTKPVRALSYVRKSNKDFFLKNNTWTSTTMKHYAYSSNPEKFEEINVITTSKFEIFTVSVASRIESYEQKYTTCINKTTELSNWIKAVQAKGPPSILNEGYTPPSRSRIHDYFNFPSLSTKPKRKKLTYNEIPTPSAKSSLSTLFRKATDTLSTTYKQPLKRQNKSAESSELTSTNKNYQPRFSFSTSLSRFSLSKNNNTNTSNNSKEPKQNKRFSIPAHTKNLSPSHVNDQKKYQTISSSTMNNICNNKKKSRTPSSILPNSPSSVFLDKLRSRVPNHETKECPTIQPNTLQRCSISTDDETPPTSPSSIDSVSPPLTPRTSSHHFKRSQETSLPNNSKKPSHQTVKLQGIVEVQDEDNYPHITSKKKKHASLLIAPSLSTIRFISQKSHFLKRQSMLA